MIPGRFAVRLMAAFACVALLQPASGSAGDSALAQLEKQGQIITVRWSDGRLPLNAKDKTWSQIEPVKLTLYPQVTAKPKNTRRKTITAYVKTLYSEKELAVYVEWRDSRLSANRGEGFFTDAMAIQFPIRHGLGVPLPYIGMGNPGHPVGLWLWRYGGPIESLAAEGFGSLTSQPSDGILAGGIWKKGTWRVMIKRALESPKSDYMIRFDPNNALVPAAFAIWNGDEAQRGGKKYLSAWRFLRFERAKVDTGYIQSLVWAPSIKGDPKKGKALMKKEGCGDCHSYPGSKENPETGPDLTFAGGIHRPEYLHESIKNPSAVIVPGKDYFEEENGKKVSIMPKPELSEQDVHHLTEYLRTLK